MRLLLDTHALIWWLAGDEALSPRAREAIGDEGNSIAVSAASAMEVATKFRIGKCPRAALLAQDFEAIIADQGFAELAVTVHHAAGRRDEHCAQGSVRPPPHCPGSIRGHGADFERSIVRQLRNQTPLVAG